MKTKKGFTLLELLLVIAIIASLAGIILMALNPAQRLEEANEVKSLANAKDIEKALNAYVVEHGGQFPTNLQTKFNNGETRVDICVSGQNCAGIDLTQSLIGGGYLSSIPLNTQYSGSSGFYIMYNSQTNGITVSTVYASFINESFENGIAGWSDSHLAYDDVPNIIGAYGMRRLLANYSGNILRLRRNSDSAESDFSYTENGDLDTTAIGTWLGGASGYVKTWYDQSGNGRNAAQTNSSEQPLYVANALNNKSSLRFYDTSLSVLRITWPLTLTAESSLGVFKFESTDGYGRIFSQTDGSADSSTTGGYIPIYQNANSQAISSYAVGSGVVSSINTPFGIPIIFVSSHSGSTLTNYRNGVAGTPATHTLSKTFTRAAIGDSSHVDSTYLGNMRGNIGEIIVSNSIWSDIQRQEIEDTANNYYAVYESGSTGAQIGLISIDPIIAYTGSASVKIIAQTNFSFTQTVNSGDTDIYNITAYAYTDGSAVTTSDVELYYNGNTISSTYISVGGGWYKLAGTVVGANESRAYGVQVKAGKTVYIDDFSVLK